MNLNDSGYSSPVVKGSSEEKVSFYVKQSNKGTRETVIARKEHTLADELLQICSKKKMKNMYIWGIIRGDDRGPKCINPFLLPCQFIEPKTEVEMEDAGELVCDYNMDLDNTKPYSRPQGSVFFVPVSDRKNKTGITKIHYVKLRHHDICVFASPGQNFKEALIKDSRFINVDNYTLSEKVSGARQGAEIGMNMKPADVGEIVLEVNVRRAVQSRDPMSLKKSNCADTAKRSVTQEKKQTTERSWNELSNKLCEEHAMYLFSRDDLTDQEVFSEREECLKARAWCTLLGPNERTRGTKNLDKSLEELAKVEFANNKVASRPVRFTKILCELYSSIGLLVCGSIRATCFLVSSNIICTNHHVVRDIESARASSAPYDYSEVYIDFEYESKQQSPSQQYKLKPLSYEENITSRRLDYAFLFLEECVEGKLPLGELVRCDVPEWGVVCIVGHPGTGDWEKQDQLCPIIPLRDNIRSLEIEKRYRENELHYRNNQLNTFALAYAARQLGRNEDYATYDVGSMFQGSSGAPVFNMNCKIVALHSAGFPIGETSIEYGATFRAIIQDLLLTPKHSEFVKLHMPYHGHQDMDTEISETR